MSNYGDTIEKLFGSYRAEYLRESYGKLFIEPPYFAELSAERPTLLIGGRGTGKTTALRSLCFDAFSSRGEQPEKYLGVYIRINKNRVHAFDDIAITPGMHRRVFAHYFNLLVAQEFCRMSAWVKSQGELEQVDVAHVQRLSAQLCVAPAATFEELRVAVGDAIVLLEVFVNNVGASGVTPPTLSMAESPIKDFAILLHAADTRGRAIFCCVDEYENLLDTQQAIINTYIKHSEAPLSYKIGVKTSGLRTTDTLDEFDPLSAPADYTSLDIVASMKEEFLREVVDERLRAARAEGLQLPDKADTLLPGLTIENEAELLGAKRIADDIRAEVAGDDPVASWLQNQPDGRVYFLKFWRESQAASGNAVLLRDLAAEWKEKPNEWATRLGNYGYASLFWLSKGRRGARIRKYYSGNPTLLSLANGNVRFYLQIVHKALREEEVVDPAKGVSPTAQTEAARYVAESHLSRLDGLCPKCGEVKRLALAVGRVFFELTRTPEGRQPEPATFVLSGTPRDLQKVESLLKDGVTHLAFDVSPRTKATSETEIRDDEYRLHPILAPFFEITHRRKRRITLSAASLGKANEKPRAAIRELLASAGVSPANDLPTQLELFEAFYEGEATDDT